jgi:glycosyltransferase involved in cell wall biosynthesis
MKRIAIVRGPNLNSWELQNFLALRMTYDIVGFTSYLHNFDLNEIPIEIHKLISWGQLAWARPARALVQTILGDYHDLAGLRRHLRGFAIVHTAETGYYSTYQAACLKAQLGFRLVVTVWENIPFLRNSGHARKHKERVFRETDLFLAISQTARECLILEGAPAEKVVVWMPGIDTHHFRPMPKDLSLLRQFGCEPDDEIVLHIAHLYRQKGIFDLLYAFKSVLARKWNPKLKLLIAGRGPEHRAVQETVRQLNLQEAVRLIGSHPYSRMPAIHNLADIFVLGSHPTPEWQEQFGYVLVESMACGKAVVSTLSGSIPEVVGAAGILVPPADFSSLADAIVSLINSPATRESLGTKARARTEQYFDAAMAARRLHDEYDRLGTGSP